MPIGVKLVPLEASVVVMCVMVALLRFESLCPVVFVFGERAEDRLGRDAHRCYSGCRAFRPTPRGFAVMLARVFPLGRTAAEEQTETVIATFKAPQGTLVVVDDHARFREAVTGAAAIDLVVRLAPDVVLLDVVLPDMDGFAVADRLAAAGNTSAVVLTSGHDRGDFAGRIQSAPVRGFLPKEMISGPALATLLAGDQP